MTNIGNILFLTAMDFNKDGHSFSNIKKGYVRYAEDARIVISIENANSQMGDGLTVNILKNVANTRGSVIIAKEDL